MKTSNGGMVTHYEASDYPHLTWDQIVAGMNASNERRKPLPEVPTFTAHCLICPEKPGFLNTEELQKHDRENLVQHRKFMSEKEN